MSQVSLGRGEEPPMFLQRPSTGKSQDVRHILAKTFRQLYTRDAIGPDTVKNLAVSKGGDDPYHEKYVQALQKVFNERQRRMEEAAMLERHIMQAQARAMSADERQLNRTAAACDNYNELGLPPGRSNYRRCLDNQLLQKHKLLTPEDYSTEEPAPVPPPMAPKLPSYARDTVTSRQHLREEDLHVETPMPLFDRSRSDMGYPSVASAEEGTDISEQEADRNFLSRFPQNDAWKSQLNEEQREQERNNLNNLRSMIEYKRNPRHIPPSAPAGGRSLIKAQKNIPKEIGIQKKPKPPSEPKQPAVVFLVSPPAVVFNDYKVGQVYELTLTLKNVSACIRQCRALPASTPYFSIGLGQFPGEHGLVAPGMSCHYDVRFAPDSLRNFDDEIRIQTQSSTPIIVPILGRRQPPKLSLPPVIDLGYCLVGGCHVTQLVVKNEGGHGKFCILPTIAWPTTNFKAVVHNGHVSAPPFDVRPSVLELGKDETGLMEIVFQPSAVKEYNVDITLVSDNCNVKHFTLKGISQKAGVELISVERGMTEPSPGELNDVTSKHLVKFDNLNPFTYTDRNAIIKNTTNVSLPYQWMIYKPQFELSGDYKKSDRVPDVDSVFSVHPPSGMLPPGEEMEFKLTFAPPVVDIFHSALHLLLNMVPPSLCESSKGSSATERSGDDSNKSPNDDDDISDLILNHNDMAPFGDVTALEIEVKGESTPLNVVVHPWAVHVPGKHLVGISVKKTVTMANHSRSTITFQWEPYTENHILEVEPPFGELDPGMAMDMELCITGPEPGKIDHTLYCHVMNLEEPITLHVQAEFKGPEVMIEEPDLNFGLVQLGQVVSKEITICNMAQIITSWSIQDCPAFATSEDEMAVSELTFEPSGGELKPLETRKITVMFNPQCVKSVKRVLEITVEDGEDCNIACYAEVQVAQVCLVSCECNIEECYKGVPVSLTATLLNQTMLPTVFEWGEVQGEDAKDCSITMDPKIGGLGPREEKPITVNFTANREGEFADLRVPCKIDGMQEALVLAIFVDVKGLAVNYRVSADERATGSEDSELKLDFGADVELRSVVKLYLHVRNLTAMTASFNFSMENYYVKPPSPPGQSRDVSQSRAISQRRVMLGKTPNLADPFSKTDAKALADLSQAMLSQGQGAAFVLNPPTGFLTPFGAEVIEVTAYSDIWGQYSDNLLCKMGDLEVTKIPVSMTVSGCPLSFQMTAGQPDLAPVLRFGTHVAGTAVCKRNMRVNNSSPYAIRVDWEVFNIEEGDDKLLDLLIYFGHAFPQRDANGKEIVPPNEVPEPVTRQPTDFIPNSEDTTPTTSREVTEAVIIEDTNNHGVPMETKPPNVVSVCCRPHEGQRSTAPYSITPSQLVIPAKGHANVSVSFTPHPTDQIAQDTNCPGFALGYMSLDDKRARDVEGKVARVEGYMASEMRLDMTALIKPALLTIECAEDEGMRYRAAMSNLLRSDGQLMVESLQTCSVMLSNQTLTPLTFRLVTSQPFMLVDLNPASNKEGSSRSQTTDMHTLKPRHNLIVKVAFQTTTSLLGEIADEYLNGEENGDNDGSRKIDVKDNLIVEFNNSSQQLVPLHATLTVPQFYLSKESLDFGTCLVGQTRELQFMIHNQTTSHTYWSVSQESCSETCAPDTFCVEPTAGLLEANITHISDSKSLLHLYFTAKHAEDYEAVFTFHGVLGETSKRLYVRGQGSYDGKHEALLNV